MAVPRWVDKCVWKATILMEEGKNKWALCAETYSIFATVVENTDSGVVANGLATGSRQEGVMETWPIKIMSIWSTALWKSVWESEGYNEVGHNPNKTSSSFGRWVEQTADTPALGGHPGPQYRNRREDTTPMWMAEHHFPEQGTHLTAQVYFDGESQWAIETQVV